jgi:hypothetical protein
VKEFAEGFLKFIQGKIKDETMEKRLRRLLAQTPDEPEGGLVPGTPPTEPAQAVTDAASVQDATPAA